MHKPPKLHHLVSLLISLTLFTPPATTTTAADVVPAAFKLPPPSSVMNSLLPSDAVAMLSFKSKADLDNKLLYTLNERFDYCQWQGVKCVQGRVVRFALHSFGLRGVFSPNTLSRLDQLRVLILSNNSLAGPVPDLSPLFNLRTLFLDRNYFSGAFPLSILSLHRLQTLDLARNTLAGSLPASLSILGRLSYLHLEFNRFNGTIPPLNQTSLFTLNVSNNNLSGPIPVTDTLSKFDISAFSWNPNLCGEIINKPCRTSPFFNSASPPSPLIQSGGVILSPPQAAEKKHKSYGLILGFIIIGILILIACCFSLLLAWIRHKKSESYHSKSLNPNAESQITHKITTTEEEFQASEPPEPEIIQKPGMQMQIQVVKKGEKSGDLVFCVGESALYSLDQLMRASAELLGRGSIGTTYKAVMDNGLGVTVKRLDAGKTGITGAEAFERHMEQVGGLRHPNLVPVRAYFQAKQERLVIYDYQPNGSLFNLIHGSRSTRAKPLHWTSCLKIAEDVAQGVAYIHQASKLIHGNLKSSNILLGPDFEACVTDYCLVMLADDTSIDDPDSARYKAPETRKSSHRATPKSDVYAYGVLLLELLTGKSPSQHPFLAPTDMLDWVRAMREDDNGDDNRLEMLVDVTGVCSLTSPEQRPTMWQVLKMIQGIKERAMVEDKSGEINDGFS